MRWFSAIAIGAALAGCASMAPPGTPAYAEGWRYGCWQGYDDGGSGPYFGQLLTPPRHEDSPDYQRGWDDAYGECYRRAIMQSFDSGL